MAYKGTSIDGLLDKVLGIVIITSIFAATVGLVLASFTNISAQGLALGVLFSSVLGLLFAVFVFRTYHKMLR